MLRFMIVGLLLTACGQDVPRYTPGYCDGFVDLTRIRDFVGLTYANSGDFSELVRCLPTDMIKVNGGMEYRFFPVVAAKVELQAGQTVLVTAEFEVTNDTGANIMIASQLLLVRDLGEGNPEASGSVPLGEGNGFNVTPDMHHGLTTKVAQHTLSKDFTGYLVLYAWAATDAFPAGTLW
jgi:hypothetical protein